MKHPSKTDSALRLARQYPAELRHMEQVARLAGILFDESRALHRRNDREKELLVCAALLHDVGISVSFAGHHKHSRRLILESDLPGFSDDERRTVAALARYHRKADPSEKHGFFRALLDEDRRIVRQLAAILRLADGLDRAHENAVDGLKAGLLADGGIVFRISGPGDVAYAAESAARKAGLFESVFGIKVRLEPARST